MAGEPKSVLKEHGLKEVLSVLKAEISELYSADQIPWVIGYSGGKDSTAVLELVWLALRDLPNAGRVKPVHVISTDTLVENPVVAGWVALSLARMAEAALREGLPIQVHRLRPTVGDTFWVNLIGRGYPAPRHMFRWCTERLKINPSNRFIREVVQQYSETVLVLGSRKAESSHRAATMAKYERGRVRGRLSPNGSLAGTSIFTPIEEWSNDDVWMFLMSVENCWGHSNKDLMSMYRGASADNECPLVLDTSTPSCGDSRFGCWVCTMVEKDKSMEAMIQNDEEKVWMTPLLAIRNDLDLKNDKPRRDFRRMSGRVQLFHGEPIHGPYKKEWRERWLRNVLRAQGQVRRGGPPAVRELDLISLDELHEIRRIWLAEKHEFEDAVPTIYQEETGELFPAERDDDAVLGKDDWHLLQEVCGGDALHSQLVADMLDTERRYRAMVRRVGIHEALERAIKQSFYKDEEDAVAFAREKERLGHGPNGLDDAEGEP